MSGKKRRKQNLEPGQDNLSVPRTTQFYRNNPRGTSSHGVNAAQGEETTPLIDAQAQGQTSADNHEIPADKPENSAHENYSPFQSDDNFDSNSGHNTSCGRICAEDTTTTYQKSSFEDKYEWDTPLTPSIKTTKFEAFLMILHLNITYGMSGPFIEDMLQFVNALIGENVLQTSKYIFHKLFSPKTTLKYHMYCPVCELYLGEKGNFSDPIVKCSNCDHECKVQSLQEGNFFITLSLKEQLADLLQKPNLKIMPHLNRDHSKMHDMMDGSLYRVLCVEGNFLSDENSLSLTFNTDGAPVFKSSNTSIWPIQLFINEISPDQRFMHDNVLLYAVWFGDSAPSMTCFMKPFVTEMNDLAINGVVRRKCDGTIVNCPVFAIGCAVDSVAKPKLQVMKQFNGTYGCGYCLHPGDQNIPGGGSGVRYTTRSGDYPYPYRSDTSMRADMDQAETLKQQGILKKGKNTKDHVHCLKGCSPLCALPGFHIVFGFHIDYMHALLAGVAERTAGLWFDSSSHDQDYYIGTKEHAVDSLLKGITPPQTVTCLPKPISERSDWKCKDWKAWLLYYSLPCLKEYLPPSFLENWSFLVTATHILLKDSISPLELNEAEVLLDRFVLGYNNLYSDVNMVYNVHLCSHLANAVSLWGPLWAYSAFSFESGNGHLKKLINGTRSVENQVCLKYSAIKFVDKYVENRDVSQRILDFCGNVITYSYIKKSHVFGDVTALGGEVVCDISEEERSALTDYGAPVSVSKLSYYNRVVRNEQVYYSKAYKKPKRIDDTCVQLTNSTYVVTEKIIKLPNFSDLWVFVRPIRISVTGHLTPHIKACSHDLYDSLKIVPFGNIKCKCVRLTCDTRYYVCDVPNFYEKD